MRLIRAELQRFPAREREQILADLRESSPEFHRQYLRLLRTQREGDSHSTNGNNSFSARENSQRRNGRGRDDGPTIIPSEFTAGNQPPVGQIGHSLPGENRPESGRSNRSGAGHPDDERWRRLPTPKSARNENVRDADNQRIANGPTDGRQPSTSSRRFLGNVLAGHRTDGEKSTEPPGRFPRFSWPGLNFNRRSPSETPHDDGGEHRTIDGEQAAADEWDRSLRRLIAIAEARAAKETTPDPKPANEIQRIRGHVYLRLLYLIAGQYQQATDPIPGIGTAEQEFWQNTLWGLAEYVRDSKYADPERRATQTLSRLATATAHLRSVAELEIKNLVFCQKITNFGNYQQTKSTTFRAGEQVLIYAEIDSFKSELTEEGRYRTRLKSTIEIYPDNGGGAVKPLSNFQFSPTEDICRQRRRDYFHSYIINLPDRIPLGTYKLKLTVVDQLGGKIATDVIRFTVN